MDSCCQTPEKEAILLISWLETSGLQKHRSIWFCYIKPASYWCSVVAALGTQNLIQCPSPQKATICKGYHWIMQLSENFSAYFSTPLWIDPWILLTSTFFSDLCLFNNLLFCLPTWEDLNYSFCWKLSCLYLYFVALLPILFLKERRIK